MEDIGLIAEETSAPSSEVINRPIASEEEVTCLAHALWEARGGGDGYAEEDWYRAEEIIRGTEYVSGR